MRILVVTPYFYPHTGGTERYVEELYGALIEKDPSVMVDVLTYNTNRQAKREAYKGLTIYRIGVMELLKGQFALPNYFELFQLVRKLEQNHYDVVNAHTRFFDTAWWGWWLARYLGAKSILTDHCAYHPNHPSRLVRAIAKTVDHWLIPWLGKKYDLVTAVSEATKQFLTDHGMGRQIHVVYGGVDGEMYNNTQKHDGVRVSFIGRMIPTKGPQLVVKAAKELLLKYPNLTFMFAGEGELLAALRVHENGRMQFLGNLDREKVVELLKVTDIVVLPSTHHEGLPKVIVEAGAAGCAVITTNRGGVKELIIDGKTGMLIRADKTDLVNALEKLIANRSLCMSMGETLHKRVKEQFNWDLIAQKYQKMLKV